MSWVLAFVGFAILVILQSSATSRRPRRSGCGSRSSRSSSHRSLSKAGQGDGVRGQRDPAGSYVRITGMNPSEELSDELRTRAYYSQPVWKRIVVIAARPAVNLLVAFILLFVFFFLIGPETATTKVGVMEKGYPAATALKSGDKLVTRSTARGATPPTSSA